MMPTRAEVEAHDVLVIDDSEVARRTMARLLSAAGLRVLELPSPIGATRAILRHRVRCVVIDVNMPAIRGDRLATLFRQNPRFAELRLVLVSGMNDEELASLGHAADADAVVSKERLDALRTVVKRLVAGGSIS